MLAPLWQYHDFILGSVKRELQSKYSNSLLGAGWIILNPLAMIVVYTVIFAQVMKTRLPETQGTFAYSIYLCAGLFAWELFSEIIRRSQNSFIENSNLIKKINFPRICLPVIVVINALLNFTIIFSLFSIFLVVSGNFPGLAYICVLPLLGILSLFAVGLGVTLGVLNVFFRDVGQLFAIVLQFWFWLTPIVYPPSILPSYAQWIMKLNPMAPLISGFQHILVNRQWPHWETLTYPALSAFILCLLGFYLFRKHGCDMVDEL